MFVTTKPASRRASQVEAGIAPATGREPPSIVDRKGAEGAGLEPEPTLVGRLVLGQPSHLGISTLRHAITVRAGLPAQTDSRAMDTDLTHLRGGRLGARGRLG